MPSSSVAIRLGTTGKSEVVNDFAEIGRSGTTAFSQIGDAGDAAARRAQNSFARASTDLERSLQAQARAAQRLATIQPQTSTQFRINQAAGTGFGEFEGSARRSAAAFRELLIEQDRFEAKARAIRAELDPLAAAQDRYNRELAETRQLQAAGLLTADQAVAQQARLKAALDATSVASQRAGGAVRNQSFAYQNIGFQIQDFAVQVAGGTSAIRAFAQQAPQTAGALALLGGGVTATSGAFGRFAAFLGGPWGAAIITAGTIALSLAAATSAVGDAQSQASVEAERLKRAEEELNRAAEAVTRSSQAEAQAHLVAARAAAVRTAEVRKTIAANLELARDRLAEESKRSIDPTLAGEGGFNPGAVRGADIDRQVRALEAQLAAASAEAENAERRARTFSVAVERVRAAEATDKAAAATGRYERAEARLALQVIRDSLAPQEYRQRLIELTRQRDAEIDAASRSERATGRDATAKRGAAIASREAAQSQRDLAGSLASLVGRFDPATAAAQRYRDTLAEIVRLREAGRLTAEQADSFAGQARREAFDAEVAAEAERRRRQLQDVVIRDPGDLTGGIGGAAEQIEREAERRKRFEDVLQQQRVQQVQSLASLYETLFTQGTRGFLKELETRGIQVLALLLAQITQGERPGGDGGIGSILGTILGTILGGSTGGVGGGFGGGQLPGFASGTRFFSGGSAIVGEGGPERVFLPRGTRIINASDTRRMTQAGAGVNVSVPISIDARGADPAGLSRVEREVATLRKELPGMIVTTVADARSRRVI